MTEFAYVNPADVFDIQLLDFSSPPVPLSTGNRVQTPSSPGLFALGELPVPGYDVYTLVRDTAPGPSPAEYYDPVRSYTFVGVVRDAAATVAEAITYNEIPIAQLYEIQRRAIFNYDQQVRYNAVDSALSANWWLIVTQDLRFEIDGIQGNWLQRQIDGQGFPGGANAPWVGIFNANTQDSRRFQVTSAANWDTLYLEKTLHDQQTGNATEASRTALDAAYDDGNGAWQDVADHDPQDPAWGYPPTIDIGEFR